MNNLIVTLIGYNNFGNRLQNYALQEVLLTNGSKYVETLSIASLKDESLLISFIRAIKYKFFIKTKKNNRFYKFKNFNSKYILMTNKTIHFYSDLKKLNKEYDYFIVGSDQVWNHNMTHNFNIYFLENVDNTKKISYAASFGVDFYDSSYKFKYKQYLNEFKSLSVRENIGKKIVIELTNRNDVEVLVDPTMLLTTDEWDKVSIRPSQLDDIKEKKYILNYFLGELSESRKKEIDRIAEKYECHIINILDKNDPFYDSGPSEFLYLEKHAFLICTDSFHSCVFAILYNRPFVVFDREQKGVENMNSRIDTLINKFNLKDRKYNGKNITTSNLNHDYTDAYKILESERKKSNDFLKKALDIE